MDASVIDSAMDEQSTYVSQDALYGTADAAESERGDGRAPATSLQASRSFFIIDKSRMVGERDTVEDARVVYLPESEFQRELYHSRCSCLVGVADVYRNMTGEFPHCLSMAGCCYACTLLEPNYFMFLLGRPLEPPERVQATLQHISDIFHFYYHSPQAVMTKSRGDWQIFTVNMTFIFSKIREYVFRDPHSIAFMFRTLPYNQNGRKQSRLFLQASQILRSCQQQEPIVGGCIMYNTEIVCNQLPTKLMEKLQVIGGNGIELNTKSVLADNIAPETVWVLEVHLSPEEVEDMADSQRDHSEFRQAYHDMTPNPSLIDSAVTFCSRFQPPSAAGHASSSSSSRSGRRTARTSSGWRSRSRPVQEQNPVIDEDYYNVSIAFHSLTSQKSIESVKQDSDGPQAMHSASSSTITVLPELSQAQTSSPQVPRNPVSCVSGKKDGRKVKTEPSRERAGQNMGKTSNSSVGGQKISRLHGRSEKRDFSHRPYTDPDTFPDSNTYPSVARPKTSSPQGEMPHQSLSGATPAIPASPSIPIPVGQPGEREHPSSSGPTGRSSSLEEEKFATPSPNFSVISAAALSKKVELDVPMATTVEEGSANTAHSSSFQTAEELSSRSSPSQSPAREQDQVTTEASGSIAWSIYNTLTPPLPHREAAAQTKQSEIRVYLRRKLEDSDDFVDSSVLDQIISEARQMSEEAARPRSNETNINNRDSPPELPPRNYEVDDFEPPPQLPPRGVSLATNSAAAPQTVLEHLVSDSGEFTVVEIRPPSVPHHLESQVNGTESTPPPSPPPRTLSRKMSPLPCPPTEATPPPPGVAQGVSSTLASTQADDYKETEVVEPASAGDVEEDEVIGGAPVRSASSSPDRQHRGLTQSQGTASDEEGGKEGEGSAEGQDMETVWESLRMIEGQGWLGEAGGEANKETETENRTRQEDSGSTQQELDGDSERQGHLGSSVDPLNQEETRSIQDDGAEETCSIAEMLTSDEEDEESGNEVVADVSTATFRYRHRSTSTPREARTRVTHPSTHGGGPDNSLSIQNLSVQSLATPTEAGATPSLSFTQLNTPEMTLQLSMAERLRGTADEPVGRDGGGEAARSQAAMVASDMARIHQTLGRNLQLPAKPAPQLETWCIYVQKQFNTMIVLATKAGLQDNHSLLTELWKSLLPQLFALDQGLEGMEGHETSKRPYNLAVYNNTDQYCAVETRKALYKFRHAIRHTHLEYQKSPDLCQITLLHNPRMVSQRVMGREIYYHHQKGITGDTFTATTMLTRTARQNTLEPLSGGTPAHFL